MLYRAILCATAALSLGCVAYVDSAPPEAMLDAAVELPVAGDAGAPVSATAEASVSEAAAPVPAPADAALAAPAPEPNLRLAHSARFAGYLTDGDGRALYMFAEDVAGSQESACVEECARSWPPFDLSAVLPEAGLLANDITRLHRQDGRWQAAYKGHPLYYREGEQGTRDVTGDGVDGRWFVARDYLAFLSVSRSFAPAGSDSFEATFLTNGFGRTLYICLDDTPGDGATAPVSSCAGECVRRRPIWSVSEASRTTILPSLIAPSDLSELTRPDGAAQLVLRGWPVYYFMGDESSGDTHGQNQNAWRAIDPINFGRQLASLAARRESL